MTGLVLKLEPGEAFLVNGIRLQNGDKPGRIRVSDPDARVLRCSDAMLPQDVKTPVSQIYYAVQLIITGDLDEAATLPALKAACVRLVQVFIDLDPSLIERLCAMIERRTYYSALCYMKQLLVLERHLLDMPMNAGAPFEARKVA